MNLIDTKKMDKSVFEIKKLEEQGDDREYWATKTYEERWEALEFMRQVVYGYDPSTERIQRVFTIANSHGVEYLLVGGYAVAHLDTRGPQVT